MKNTFCKRGFILGVVLLLSLIMAAFIFSYNSIVRSRNLKAHHYMISELVTSMAVSGVKMLSKKTSSSFETTIKLDCPELFYKQADQITQPLLLSSYSDFCNETREDFQKFLNQLDEFKEPGVLSGGFPICEKMEITIDELTTLAPETNQQQFQKGRDPVEKCGMLKLTCVVNHYGISRKASISQQFRIVSMVPAPFARFTLFVRKTPYPDSYNSMGVQFDGSIDSTYKHPPADNMSFTGPLTILNGTDTEVIDPNPPFKDQTIDELNLKQRGWIYLGASGPSRNAPVYLKIPNGFANHTGGLFMFSPPTDNTLRLIAPAKIDFGTDFKKPENISSHDFYLGSKFHGYYTSEEDNPQGIGAKNLWPGLTTGPLYQPSDRYLSASSWLYPFGNRTNSSRTLIIGPVLAGYLKYFFIKGTGLNNKKYRGLFSSMSPSAFLGKQTESATLIDYCYFWSGLLDPPIIGRDFFLNGYESCKLLMPFNSLPENAAISDDKGIAFNSIFDFMKYDKNNYPDPEDGSVLNSNNYFNKNYLVPMAEAMNNNEVKGVHPSGDLGIFFNQNSQYDPNFYPDNCYYYGDLADLTVAGSNLVSNRITNILDLSDCESTKEESERLEHLLFKDKEIDGETVSIPRKSGIFLIKRRNDISLLFDDSITLSNKKVVLDKPLIILLNRGSLSIETNIISELDKGAPKFLCTLALCQGDVYITGKGSCRTIHAYLAITGNQTGRLLKPPTLVTTPETFEIFGGLAVTELGLYQDKSADPRSEVGSTMLSFPAGGKIIYNSRFNPGLSHYKDSRILSIEPISGSLTTGGAL